MALPAVPPIGSLRNRLLRVGTDAHVAVMRLSGGRIGAQVGKASMLTLHHTGRKSGASRTTPLLYIREGDDYIIVASRGGSDQHPAWYLNLRDMDETAIELGRRKVPVAIREVEDEAERERIWAKLVEVWPDYDVYTTRTTRKIPVIALAPLAGSSAA